MAQTLTFGERVRRDRRAAKLRQRELGDRVGFATPQNAIYKIESGRRGTSDAMARRIARALGQPSAEYLAAIAAYRMSPAARRAGLRIVTTPEREPEPIHA